MTLHWTDSLYDSVYSLYEAATEYRTAYLGAYLARRTTELDRRRVHDGEISIRRPLGDTGDTRSRRRNPHEHALCLLSARYVDAELDLKEAYERAALQYASGAAWAVRRVQTGDTPAVVEVLESSDGARLLTHPLEVTGLERYAGAAALQAAYRDLSGRLAAAEAAEDLSGRSYLADHEASAMHDALDTAAGIADAAYAYGQLLHKALSFVQIGPRREHERQLALARAQADTTT